MALVAQWVDDARAAGLLGADTMVVATSTVDGRPSARAVILRGLDPRGFVFYTDTRSRKGVELADNPWAAVVLVWEELERSVRAEGRVEAVAGDEADAYFAGRPRGHQVGAWASRQSEPLADRDDLVRAVADAEARFAGRGVPRPPYWGGYRIVPEVVEFWEGRPDRLHDRVRYRRGGTGGGGAWVAERLWP
jgi:pyridoxamine 5'-phosphate oxidase